jgi:hypothetical protein
MTAHRESFNQWKKGKRELTTSFLLFDEYGIENCSIVLLELCPCETKDVLHAREAHYIRTIKCVNKLIPLRTYQEYNDDNKESHKEYYQINKERICNRVNEYRKQNIDSIRIKKKLYRQANKEKINEQERARYAANKLKKQLPQSSV